LLGSRRLAAAVFVRTSDEPLLVACSALSVDGGEARDDVAPGLLETAAAIGAIGLPHVAALDDEWCTLETGQGQEGAAAIPGDDRIVVAARGWSDLQVRASRSAATSAIARFADAKLDLVALDSAACALLGLALHLGRAVTADAERTLAEARDLDPLTAVSVAPECEGAAARAGGLLAVPVGLALVRFGRIADA
jgi:hypothetical protein